MKLKLKNLKFGYFKCKRENSVSGAAKTTCPFYEELDILYSTRPNVQVLHDASGIDTANIQDDLTGEYIEEYIEDSQDTQDSMNDSKFLQDSASTSTIDSEPPRKKKRGLSGRKSYETILDKYTEKMQQSQKQFLSEMIIKQNDMQKEMLKVEMENQRLWEKEIIEKEHAFQREQMQSFLQVMQAVGSQAQAPSSNYGMPQNVFMPQNYGIPTNYKLPQNVKIIPV